MRTITRSLLLVILMLALAWAGTPCSHCSGTGKCWSCGGTGESASGTCSMCNGSKKCWYCGGSGES